MESSENLRVNPEAGLAEMSGPVSIRRKSCRMKWTFFWTSAVALAFGFGGLPAARAQMGMPGGEPGFNSLVTKLFRHIPTFSASVDTTMTNKSDRSRVMMPMKMAKRDNVLRIEVDLIKVRGAGISLQSMTALQNVGMSRMVSLMFRGTNAMSLLFPDLKFYTRVGLPDAELMDEKVEIVRKSMGRDLVNGYTCMKQDVTVNVPGGTSTRVTAWEAADLKNFPVRMYFQDENASVVMDYRDVKLTVPGTNQFVVPSDYRYFATLPQLMQEATANAVRTGTQQ